MTILSDFVNKLKNNTQRFKPFLKCPASKLTIEICKVFFKENLIRGFFLEKQKNKSYLLILFKYGTHQNLFEKLIFINNKVAEKTCKPSNNLGISLVSTTKGLMSNRIAIKLGVEGKRLLKAN